MYKICVFNTIAEKGLQVLKETGYDTHCELKKADAILLRSHALHDEVLPNSLKAIARAGAGVNNIPVSQLTQLGIPVFNTPGANANAVKELVILGMLLACRNIPQALSYTKGLEGDNPTINKLVEANKKQFAGFELPGKTLAVIGLGAIGVEIANTAIRLGMAVIGYDPAVTIQRAWQLSASVKKAQSIEEALTQADFVTIHVPFTQKTTSLFNHTILAKMKQGTILLNFSRGEIVEKSALLKALKAGNIYKYVCDFPAQEFMTHPQVIYLPHLGAATKEAEENCSIMAAETLHSFFSYGDIKNSVNFPTVYLPAMSHYRLCLTHLNAPNMVGQISTTLAQANINIIDMINKSREQIAYTALDLNQPIANSVIKLIENIEGILKIRLIKPG